MKGRILFLWGKLAADARDTEARDGNEGFAGREGLALTGKFTGVGFEIFKELLKFTLHLIHFGTHIENDLDTGEIDAEFAGKREDYLEAFEIGVFVKACITHGSRWQQQTFALIKAQSLRVDVVQLRHRADRVGFYSLLHFSLVFGLCTLVFGSYDCVIKTQNLKPNTLTPIP